MRNAHALAVPDVGGADRGRVLPVPAAARRAPPRGRAAARAHGLRRPQGPRRRGGGAHRWLRRAPRREPLVVHGASRARHLPLGAPARAAPPRRPRSRRRWRWSRSPRRRRPPRPARSCGRPPTCSLWQPGPFGFRDELARTGLAVELISILAVLSAAWLLFRPLAAPRDLPDPELRRTAAQHRRASTEATRSRSSSCGATSTTSSTPTAPRSSATGSRAAC